MRRAHYPPPFKPSKKVPSNERVTDTLFRFFFDCGVSIGSDRYTEIEKLYVNENVLFIIRNERAPSDPADRKTDQSKFRPQQRQRNPSLGSEHGAACSAGR